MVVNSADFFLASCFREQAVVLELIQPPFNPGVRLILAAAPHQPAELAYDMATPSGWQILSSLST